MAETISKSKLKARMLEIFRRLEDEGVDLIVTDHGKPVLRITPIRERDNVSQLFAGLQGRVVYHEDINEPTIGEWSET